MVQVCNAGAYASNLAANPEEKYDCRRDRGESGAIGFHFLSLSIIVRKRSPAFVRVSMALNE